MASPPSISHKGASQTTGGILCGQAQGNIFNHADADDISQAPHKGKVYIHQSPQDPDPKTAETSITSEVTPYLKPVLKTLAQRFSPVSSKLFFLIYMQQKIYFVRIQSKDLCL